MTDLESNIRVMGRVESLRKVFQDLFSSPVDAFDFYGNTSTLQFWHIFFFHIALWIYAPIFKFIHNIIQIKFILNTEENNIQFTDGILVPVLVYPILYILGWVLEMFRLNFKQVNSIQGSSFIGIGNISFLAISSTSIFWIFPKPLNFFFLIIGISYSLKLYYNSILSFDNLSKEEFIKLFLYYLILLGFISFVLILIGNFIRGN